MKKTRFFDLTRAMGQQSQYILSGAYQSKGIPVATIVAGPLRVSHDRGEPTAGSAMSAFP
jgi:hypothetical protein